MNLRMPSMRGRGGSVTRVAVVLADPLKAIVWCVACGLGAIAQAACPPDGMSRDDLDRLRQEAFRIDADAQRQATALALIGCIGDSDPQVRDGTVFNAVSNWLRGKALDATTIQALRQALMREAQSQDDVAGFRRPFAILLLSEVARADRIDPVFSDDERHALVALASDYLAGVRDYRGFSDTDGWRHGVAHGADLVLQLAINPQVRDRDVEALMDALASRISPAGAVAYIHGEPERLARAVFFVYRRGVLDARYWNRWFGRVSAPAPLSSWEEAFTSEAGLAHRHNVMAFLLNLLFAATTAEDGAGRELQARARSALVRVMGG